MTEPPINESAKNFEVFLLYDPATKHQMRVNSVGSHFEFPRSCELVNEETGERIRTTVEHVLEQMQQGSLVNNDPVLECLDGPDECEGKVEYRSTDGYKAWPRCEKHFADRLDRQEHINELTSVSPASWFDPSYAGERWDDDY